jgi:glycosyltransferase involved in cell wall biosynthesis
MINATSVCENYRPAWGGMFTSASNFYQAMSTVGEARVVSFTNRHYRAQPRTNGTIAIDVPTNRAPLFNLYGVASSPELADAEQAIATADIVFIHGLYRFAQHWASVTAFRHGVPTVLVPHGSLDPYVLSYRRLRKKAWLATVGRRIVGRAGAMLFSTEQEMQKASPYHFGARTKVIPWPVDLPATVDRTAAGAACRRALGIPANGKILLFMGRLDPMKRPRETVDDFVASGAADWHLAIAGPETREVTARALIASAGIDKSRVHYLGTLLGSDKERILQGADAYVLFSHRENFGFTIAEAMAAATPVLVSEEVDIAPVIVARGCGWSVPATTSTERRRALRTVLTQSTDDERRLMGMRGRDWVLSEWTSDKFASRLQELAAETIIRWKAR